MFTALYELARNKRMVWPKAMRGHEERIVDPNQFPIHSVLSKVEKYEALWEAKEIMRKVEQKVGHQLVYKESSIDHPGM